MWKDVPIAGWSVPRLPRVTYILRRFLRASPSGFIAYNREKKAGEQEKAGRLDVRAPTETNHPRSTFVPWRESGTMSLSTYDLSVIEEWRQMVSRANSLDCLSRVRRLFTSLQKNLCFLLTPVRSPLLNTRTQIAIARVEPAKATGPSDFKTRFNNGLQATYTSEPLPTTWSAFDLPRHPSPAVESFGFVNVQAILASLQPWEPLDHQTQVLWEKPFQPQGSNESLLDAPWVPTRHDVYVYISKALALSPATQNWPADARTAFAQTIITPLLEQIDIFNQSFSQRRASFVCQRSKRSSLKRIPTDRTTDISYTRLWQWELFRRLRETLGPGLLLQSCRLIAEQVSVPISSTAEVRRGYNTDGGDWIVVTATLIFEDEDGSTRVVGCPSVMEPDTVVWTGEWTSLQVPDFDPDHPFWEWSLQCGEEYRRGLLRKVMSDPSAPRKNGVEPARTSS
ncbi:hypothetical protein TREMEDRAFT_66367 [Tremella mesenterica DSM 1558]|uniref:uncharacterized protein n=1 Tax=Tremella mesenterica (strain ATCC 24925 / CBS 8224 / DSM 1558 / NBRC 9311 / NRRL Y-6157 / RJB 2259-6 / UBC 559-6) TaxID=578456 RepID=UPI00032BA61D|nr:uncharacterized protein TREMEDRAFT_66367 [Tremella mesenterica DSM 1558]EIW65643.1 hypothetical protein TREMEDRAFT_66367 [Tremella mesenterica DSM 1558]